MNQDAIENIFRNSSNRDELFDALQLSLQNRIDNIELYKILLANPILTDDELIMYTEKLCSEFTQHRFELLMWTAKIFETKSYYPESIEKSLHYYIKASQSNPTDYQPYINALKLYVYEIDLTINKQILQFVESSFQVVDKKSIIYYHLSKHYKKAGNDSLAVKYLGLAQGSAKHE